MAAEVSVLRACARLSGLVIHIVYALLMVLKTRRRHGHDWLDTEQGKLWLQWWMRRACRLLGVKVQVRGAPCIVHDTLFVANHVSWLDILALSTQVHTRFISKHSVKHWPVIGSLAMAMGTEFIQRDRHFAVRRTIENIRCMLASSHSMTVFPEGTTTDGRQVGRFHAGLFKSVSGSRHFVQAIALRYWRQGELDNLAPYIGNDNFMQHLLRIASLRETSLEIVFTSPFQPVLMNSYDIATAAQEAITGALSGQVGMNVASEKLAA